MDRQLSGLCLLVMLFGSCKAESARLDLSKPIVRYTYKCIVDFQGDSYYDLVTRTDGYGSISGLNPSWAISASFTGGSRSTGACARQALAKIDFNAGAGKKLRIDMCFKTPSGKNFNIGDSISNNGYAGDSNHQRNDAEIQNDGTKFLAFSHDDYGSDRTLVDAPDTIQPYSSFSVEIGDNYVGWDNYKVIRSLNSTGLFALNGQADKGPRNPGPNYDIFMGMNRVVHGAYRKGTGLCAVGFKWL
ncbi:uncharacterized protein LOC106160763 [Lingula anatina]|uniref:Uncharacterized protein LOC106160763 n=1 Tax=Lingula anatina TaxID=7574 RepID=A0A1S3I3S0_LINAN|nr:uncharacterized protein LOC106160763 [Lingula anatina]XP_013392910.1 uncharacterized protein LOC106160763 [Lingula anatina]|eukprot:XP_013392908.1 uncharacterized protein LOC106160763 [Lingula anatina]